NSLLQDKGLQADIPPEKRREVTEWLGGNPRALQVLVSSLAYDSLNTLIGDNPDTWDLRDRQVSPELLRQLEENLLRRVVDHLPEAVLLFLRRLSVHRKALRLEALKNAAANQTEAFQLRDALIGRFLLERDNKYYNFNPVAREIAVYQLRQDSNAARTAHSLAAEHYLRHFKARQIVDKGGRLGGHFVEARYHLAKAGRADEISQWANLFANHLRTTLGGRIPGDPAERDANIALLSGLLEHGGAKGLELYLARLLKARRQPGDLEKALKHVRQAVSPAHVDSWNLFVELEQEVNGIDAAIRAAKEGIDKVSPEKNVFVLYELCAKLLARQNRPDEAIALLKDGIAKIPADKDVRSLYQSCGELLVRQNRPDEAIALLKDGIAKIPADKGVFSLYQSCGELLARQNRPDEAIALLKDGIAKIPADRNAFALYQSCGELLARQNRPDEAIALLKDGIAKIPADK
ncbi:MAG: tetratricopeptide repeat protein, partial [Gammaproteobacteria bacterium]|nr:tetratricopeptide repeat protein [Gammaproteobacteria bacterium]